MTIDREFYDALDKFVEDLVVSMPASYEGAIEALERKAREMRKAIGKPSPTLTPASDIDPTAGQNPQFKWDGDG